MPEAPTPHGAASRERILEAAIARFARDGYAATPVSELCQEAGVAPTALYWHFGSKKGVLAASLERAAETWTERIYKSTHEVTDPAARLERLMAGLRELVETRSDELALVLMACLQSSQLGSEVTQSVDRLQERALAYLVRGIEEAVGRSAPDFDLVAWTALSLLNGITIQYRRKGERADLDRLFDHAAEMIVWAAVRAVQKADLARALGEST